MLGDERASAKEITARLRPDVRPIVPPDVSDCGTLPNSAANLLLNLNNGDVLSSGGGGVQWRGQDFPKGGANFHRGSR